MHDSAARREPGRLVIDGGGQGEAGDKGEAVRCASSGQRSSGEHHEAEGRLGAPCTARLLGPAAWGQICRAGSQELIGQGPWGG